MNTMRDPMKRAVGLGSAKHGTGHFVVQRVTAVALLVLSIWFTVLVLRLIGSDYDTIRQAIATPFNSTVMVCFLLALFWHVQLGLQVIVEDYVHTRWVEITLQFAIRILCFLAGIAGTLAVIRIALGS